MDNGTPNNNENRANNNAAPNDEFYAQQRQQQQRPPPPPQYQTESEDIVQVVYHSSQNGSLIGIESSYLDGSTFPSSSSPGAGAEAAAAAGSGGGGGSYSKYSSGEVGQDNGGASNTSQPVHRSTSTLPSVAEESTTSGSGGAGASVAYCIPDSSIANNVHGDGQNDARRSTSSVSSLQFNDVFTPAHEAQVFTVAGYGALASDVVAASLEEQLRYSNATTATFYESDQVAGDSLPPYNPNAIYSTINKNKDLQSQYNQQAQQLNEQSLNEASLENDSQTTSTSFYTANCNTLSREDPSQTVPFQQPTDSADTSSGTLQKHSPIREEEDEEKKNLIEFGACSTTNSREDRESIKKELDDNATGEQGESQGEEVEEEEEEEEEDDDEKENFSKFLSRQKGGAAESGSFRNNFRKKLGVSVSTNENDLIAHRQKLLEIQVSSGGGKKTTATSLEVSGEEAGNEESEDIGNLPSKFKRTHSVSFNVGSSRSSRHSVDIRNLPSYLTHKRASIVDVAKGAMSSLMHSFGGGTSAGSVVSSKRNSLQVEEFEEPIFEEPIAPTLSLGQRVALVKNSGAEFGTVGWIGQLPDVDDDWIVGVIFDNMIGNCDGEHLGVRYFYARQNYAMFVPLSSLTKTDNYIGRPETGTMLSRMSVSLKPGQLISIHRSSIRLQHCFLNAPHQRVGHDVRAVSNRLHCQCHNCGPCAHLTKQGRMPANPLFGSHHAPNKKNSLAHMAVELLAHHHHHYHDEEEHEEEDHQFGDNSAHACNFVRYSCCQQSGTQGHDFSSDCQMVRPELLDNLIHAPRAPHRRSRLRRSRQAKALLAGPNSRPCGELQASDDQAPPSGDQGGLKNEKDYLDTGNNDPGDTIKRASPTSLAKSESSSYSSCSSSASSSNQASPSRQQQHSNYNHFSQTYQSNVFNYSYGTLDDCQMSIMDQRKFIQRRESSTYRSRDSNSTDDYYESRGLGSRIRRCFACIIGGRRNDSSARRRTKPKKRKLSARNKLIEYRRRQSTFVPSTLAKPQEDFASHGIILGQLQANDPQALVEGGVSNNQPYDSNSDYSSYSNSSRSHSPDRYDLGAGQRQIVAQIYEQQSTLSFEQQVNNNQEQLKSQSNIQQQQQQQQTQINYGDYTISDNCSIYKKDEGSNSHESALTDLGYCDTWTTNSSDTLKKIIDSSINELEPLEQSPLEGIISPLTTDFSHISDQVEISSPTASIWDQEVNVNPVEYLPINGDEDEGDESINQALEKLKIEDAKNNQRE